MGTGSSTTRIFLDNLSNQLIKKFNDKNIFAKYQYLDKDDIKERNVLDTLIKEGYDVVLFLLPNGHSYFGVENNDYRSAAETPIGTIRTNIRSSSVSYMQQFNFKLSYPDKSMKTFWSAFVEVSGDPGKKKTSKSLVDKLFICFKNNKYIE